MHSRARAHNVVHMMATAKKEKVARFNMQWRGAELKRLEEAQELCGFNDLPSTARFLMQRGLESISSQMQAKKIFRRIELEFTPQQMLPLFEAITRKAEEEQRRIP